MAFFVGKFTSMRDTSDIRFHLHHELDEFYHQLFDNLANMELKDGDAARVTQLLLNSRLDALKHLVSEEEMTTYLAAYPED
jgi:hercynine metabolism small protein